MFKTIKYISALTVAGVSLAACSDSIITNSDDNTISGTGEKTPVEIAVTLQDTDTGAKTRAVDGSFETDDQLIAYVQQVEASEAPIISTTTITEKISKLVTWKLSQKAISEATKSNNQMTVTSDNSDGKLGMTIYWDDFSNSTDDIRGEKRFLRVGYGYCYNGGTPSTTLTEATGNLGWTVQSDQSVLADKKKSDLLWASATVPFIAGNYVKYEHVVTDRKPLPVTYTHAMSKVTIELVLEDESYATDNSGIAAAFNNKATTPTLYANKTASVDAINQSITATVVSGDDAKIQMYLVQDANSTNPKTRIYEAIIAPTVMKASNVLAEVTVDGNKYELKLTDALLKTLPEGRTGSTWASELYSYTSSDGKVSKNSPEVSQTSAESPVGITKSGINYYLVAKLKKQKIEVSASIADWNPVYSSTEGLIQFSADVTNPTVSDGSTPVTNTSFDLWMSSTQTDATTVEGRPSAATYDANTTTEGIQKASTYTYNSTTSKWEGSPDLYWPNGDQKYYFRALATTTNGTTITSVDGSQAAVQGTDLLWAQTSEHTGAGVNYSAGAAINPRTGDVPLTFQHAMSKISVTLKNKYTSTGVPAGVTAIDYNDPRNPLVNLEGAKISIINLYDKGTIDISNGKMMKTSLGNSTTDPYTFSSVGDENKVNDDYKWLDKIVVPQSLEKDKEGANRDTNPSFYSLANLTAIYSNGKSIPVADETPTYYLTTALEKVEEKYTEAEANAYNLKLPAPAAVWTTSTVKEPERLYTYDEYKTVFSTTEYQTLLETKFTELPDKAKQIDYTFNEFKELPFTADLFAAIPNELKIKTPAGYYTTAQEYNEAKGLDNSSADKTALTEEQFAALTEAEKAYPAVFFQDTEISEFKTALASKETVFISLSGDWKKKTLTLDEYKALNPVPEELFNLLPESLKTRPAVTYTVEEVNAHNATLPGAVHEGDIKTIYHKIKENTTPESHKIGELINRGNKIMLYVTLADGTIYSIDLATCKVDGSDVGITEWLGGYHYNYTITLSKEEITFRALVKDWVPAKGSGNATLDWD